MFTGIVTDVGRIAAVSERDQVRRLSIESAYAADTIAIGASIGCGGICLTVVGREARAGGGATFDVDLAPETLRVTGARYWKTGTRLNLERSLRIGDELGGHMMSGHVDGMAEITKVEELGDASRITFEAPAQLAKFIAPKGSVALDGTSLTVNGVFGTRFDCVFIPHTLSVTTWGERRVGDYVNLEVDQIARYVARLAEAG
jgi:riboflavin synthase